MESFGAPGSDIAFIVGPDGIKVEVQSVIMKLASPVFAAMLSSKFDEGQRLIVRSDEQPIEIKLPDDDAEAFSLICQILHWTAFPSVIPGSETILNIVFLADKYGLIGALTHTLESWVQNRSTKDVKDLWRLILTSYIAGLRQGFRATSRELILLHDDAFWDLAALTPSFERGYRIACALEEIRSNIWARFHKLFTYDMILESAGRLDDMHYMVGCTLEQALRFASDITGYNKAIANGDTCCGSGPYGSFNWEGALENGLRDITQDIHGLCFDCFKQGKRIAHQHECA